MFRPGDPFGMFGSGDPFVQMNRMMGAMLGADPFFHGFGGGVAAPVYQGQPRSRQPVIEEVDGEHSGRATHDDPIVEEPDDDGPQPAGRAAQRQRRHSPERRNPPAPQVAMPMDPFSSLFGALAGGIGAATAAAANGGAGNGSSFMFSSSSFSSLGPSGVMYQASSTTRMGPGGVRETQAVVRDGRSGTEEVTISRGLGDGRARTLTRRRDATGQEQQLEDLRGLAEHEADHFDDQWRAAAERALPGGGAVGAAVSRIGPARAGSGGAGAQRMLALPGAGPSYTGAAPLPAYARQQSANTATPSTARAAVYGAGIGGSGGSRSARHTAPHGVAPAISTQTAAAAAYTHAQPQVPAAQPRYGETTAYNAAPQYQQQQYQQQYQQAYAVPAPAQQQPQYAYGNAASTYAPSSTGGSSRYRY